MFGGGRHHTICAHDGALHYINDLGLDLLFAEVMGKKPVKAINIERVDRWDKLREELDKCYRRSFKNDLHVEVLHYCDTLVADVSLKLEGREKEMSGPFTQERITQWYDLKHDVESCQEPACHY